MQDKIFICAGAACSGTSWLWENMRTHPNIFCPAELKENNFRVIRPGDTRNIDDDYVKNLYADAKPNQWKADFSVNTSHASKEQWAHIMQSGDVKVCYILRNPLENVWSYFQVICELNGHAEFIESLTPRECRAFVKKFYFLNEVRFGHNHKTMHDNIPPERYKVLYYNNIAESSDSRIQFLRDVENFLGIEHHDFDPKIRDHQTKKGLGNVMPEWFPDELGYHINDQLEKLISTGIHIPESWKIIR